jgi:hypothetical protein
MVGVWYVVSATLDYWVHSITETINPHRCITHTSCFRMIFKLNCCVQHTFVVGIKSGGNAVSSFVRPEPMQLIFLFVRDACSRIKRIGMIFAMSDPK